MKRKYLLFAIGTVVLTVGLAILCLRMNTELIFPQHEHSEIKERVREVPLQVPPSTVSFPKQEIVSAEIQKIIDDSEDILLRIKLVNRLPNNLSESEKNALYDYLKFGPNNRDTHHLKNDILNELRNQLVPPLELTQVMLEIFYDEKQSMTLRCYALQHMRPWYWEENMRDPAVKQAFYDGLEQTDNELSGVALLALTYLSEELPDEFDRVFIAEKAALLAGMSEVSELTRVSALDVSSRYGNISSLEIARNILKTERDNVMLRAAACGAIGRLGNTADLDLLKQAQENSPAIRQAINSAQKQIIARMETNK